MNIAFIPARGGSKSIPMKNIKIMNGKPLIYWAIQAANDCSMIDVVYVSTDSELIRKTVDDFGFKKVRVIDRSMETSTDEASTESVMLEFAQKIEFDTIILIQATSPMISSADLESGLDIYKKDSTDSVLSVVRQKRFLWEEKSNGYARPINYDIFSRPRRQEFDGYFVENGAFYITSREKLLKHGCRLSGNIRLVEMDESSYYEIDEPQDWIIIEKIMKKRRNNYEKMPRIDLFLTDCDGCLTDGGMYYSEDGDELKKFNTRDGKGFELLRKKGIIVGIITSENRELIKRRAKKLQLDVLLMGIDDKISAIRNICAEKNIDINNVAYVGDDINDLAAISEVGWGCTVADGLPVLQRVAKYVSEAQGGQGAIREIADFILSQNLMEDK